MTEYITLTRKDIDRLRTNGAFTGATVRALGLEWTKLKKGWTRELVGKRMTREQYNSALAGVGILKKKKTKTAEKIITFVNLQGKSVSLPYSTTLAEMVRLGAIIPENVPQRPSGESPEDYANRIFLEDRRAFE